MLELSRERRRMVDVHLSRRGIHHREILAAMREVPREVFVELDSYSTPNGVIMSSSSWKVEARRKA